MTETVELTIESLAKGGEAIAHHRGQVVFVDRAAPGDRVAVELVGESHRSLRGRVVEVLGAGPDSVTPCCPHASYCGGCGWMHVSVEEQRRSKERIFYDALERIGGILRGELEGLPIACPSQPLHYRRRASLHLRQGQLGYVAARSHDVVAVDQCPVLAPPLESALRELPRVLSDLGLVSHLSQVGLLSEGERWSFSLGVDRITGVLRDRAERAVRLLGAEGCVLETDAGTTAVVGHPVLAGHRPDLFAQVSEGGNDLLVQEVLRHLRPAAGVSILELYSGSGNFTIPLAERGGEVWAIESALPALNLCRTLAGQRRMDSRIHLIGGDALKGAANLVREGRRFEALLFDPPRTGCPGVGALARSLGIRRAVMVSCDVATMARDAADLKACGLRPRCALPVDLFPQTPHIEGVMAFEAA